MSQQDKIFTEPKQKIRILLSHPERVDSLLNVLTEHYDVWKANKFNGDISPDEVLLVLERKKDKRVPFPPIVSPPEESAFHFLPEESKTGDSSDKPVEKDGL